MELVNEYILFQFLKAEKLPFPKYLYPQNRLRNLFWITKEGECVHPYEMYDNHLKSVVKQIHRQYPHLKESYEKYQFDQYILDGFLPYLESKEKPSYQLIHYKEFWELYPLYMLLRRELKRRKLEDIYDSNEVYY